MVLVDVVTNAFDRVWGSAYAARLAAGFHQDTIHVRAVPFELLDDDGLRRA